MFDVITLLPEGDNYCYVLVDGEDAVVVDACCTEPILQTLEKKGARLRMILSTHHHGDHTCGNRELVHLTGCHVVGGDSRISSLTTLCKNDEQIKFSGGSFRCIAVPGHTKGSCAFYCAEAGALFTGDTLFYAGCGRLFEGSAPEMYRSLKKLEALPAATKMYGGHEYTPGNLAFAHAVEPHNLAVHTRMEDVQRSLAATGMYGPSTIGEEHATNPFLRSGEAGIAAALGVPATEAPEKVFELLRKRKDVF